MAQSPAYNRTKDFTVNFQNETDHTALNAEFDDASNSINDIRANLAILQADDGRLRPAVITPESIDGAIVDSIISRMAGQDISAEVLAKGQFYANKAEQNAQIATEKAELAIEKANEVSVLLDAFFDETFPVGSVYQSFVNAPPSRGTWTLLSEGVVLLSAGNNFIAGNPYGANAKRIYTEQLPTHSHSINASTAGTHTHTRGSMNITGNTGVSDTRDASSGAFEANNSFGWRLTVYSSNAGSGFDASKTWEGETSSEGEHSHTMTCGTVGNNEEFNVMQRSIAVYIFRRTA